MRHVETFRKRMDNASVELQGRLWFVRYDITVPVVKDIDHGGDWWDDYEVDLIESEIEIDELVLYDPEDPDGATRVLVSQGLDRPYAAQHDPKAVLADMLKNDDDLLTWLHSCAAEMTPCEP